MTLMKGPRLDLLPVSKDLRHANSSSWWRAVEQERADAATEEEWRRRVRANRKEVSALARRLASVTD